MNPIKEYSLLAIILGLFIGLVWFGHHERIEERDAEIVAQKRADDKEIKHVQEVQANDKITIDALQAQLGAALAAPPKPGVVVRMCQPAPGAGSPLRGNPSPGLDSHATSGPGIGMGSNGQEGSDIAPGTEVILGRDKAVIDYLQGYIRECQAKGVCAKT